MSILTEALEVEDAEASANYAGYHENALYPPIGYRQFVDDFLTQALSRASRQIAQGPVTPALSRESIEAALQFYDFKTPQPLQELLDSTIELLKDGVVHFNHPCYFGLFNPAPSFPAQCADRIAAVFNPQLASAVTSPAAVAIEAHTIAAVAKRAGLPAGSSGHFTSGGSEANYTGLICALTHAHKDFALCGSRALSGMPTFYVSQDSHRAWLKIAHQAGIGRTSARLVRTDGAGRMDMSGLREAIGKDREAGCIPVMIAATAGTTNAGMVDPMRDCAQIAREEGIWLHVDAAWGGAAIASDKLKPLLAGIELADSITIDAHKWFAATMGCGMFITARPGLLSSAFHVAASYMPPSGAQEDPYVTTAQWSRRFVGLRLFLSLAAAGWKGYARHVEKSVALAGNIAQALTASGWRILNMPALGVVCALPPGGRDVRPIVGRVLKSGRAWVSAALFEGHEVVRACVTHGESTAQDVAALVDSLNTALGS
ncbi:MAG TPA: pyridoxal-dependent decarboxylase [Hyphomicrobiales bacterium]|nr:pyridoxal-dependent decarboxylase [Hyphomicrobiales bacterium]